MENPFIDIVQTQILRNNPRNQRMPFEDLCAFHAALMSGVANETVAVATGLAAQTVSYLQNAGKFLGGQIRYPAVARERSRLGDEAFVRTYATPRIRDRLAVAAEQIRLKQLAPRPQGAVRANAKRYEGPHAFTDEFGNEWAFVVRLSHEPPVGWLYGVTLEPGRGRIDPEHVRWIGDKARDGRGFATSTEAYGAIMSMINPKD